MLRAQRRRFHGMTLVELMVSLALGVILIGIMVSVWGTSQKIMTRTTDKIAVYQNLRYVLDTIEKDVANVVRTTDMEFFEDKNKSGHYEAGASEEFKDLRYTDMFFKESGGDLSSEKYFFAPLLYRPANYPRVDGFDNEKVTSHRRDEFYFRTYALIDGESRSCLVHYRLHVSDAAPQRPTLLRRVSFIDRSGTKPKVVPRETELADSITDLEFDMFYKESRINDRGHFFDAKDARANITELSSQFGPTAISLYYSGTGSNRGKMEWTKENGIWLRPSDTNSNFQFGAVRPGDRFLLFDAKDDEGDNGKLKNLFGRRYVTVEQIVALQPTGESLGAANSKIFLKFVEPIDFIALAPALLPETPTTVTEFGEADKKRRIFQSFDVAYRVAFLPGAFRVRFKYRDVRNRRLVPFERVIRVLNS